MTILLIHAGILLAGYTRNDTKSNAAKEVNEIIGAMDVEVTSLKEAANVPKATEQGY